MNAGFGFKLSHLQSMLLFAVIISIAFGFLGKRRPVDRVKYIAWALFLFLLVGVGIGWAMYPFSR
jgi:ABC-type Mn2+/Zn2+ transport system permease subunit